MRGGHTTMAKPTFECIDSKVSSIKEPPLGTIVVCSVYSVSTGRLGLLVDRIHPRIARIGCWKILLWAFYQIQPCSKGGGTEWTHGLSLPFMAGTTQTTVVGCVVSCLLSWQIAHNPPSGISQGTTIRRLILFRSVLMGYAHQFVR